MNLGLEENSRASEPDQQGLSNSGTVRLNQSLLLHDLKIVMQPKYTAWKDKDWREHYNWPR